MRIAALLLCIVLLPLSGCLSTRSERLGAEYYRLLQNYETREELRAAIEGHEREAVKLCPDGYTKRKDYDRLDGSARVLVWEVGCNVQYQPDHSKSRLPGG